MPYPDEFITKACVIHSVYFWPSIEDGLRQFHRVLGPDGLLILAVRMRREDASVLAPSRYGLIDTHIDEIVASLGEVGFRDATRERREIGRETIAAIVTHK